LVLHGYTAPYEKIRVEIIMTAPPKDLGDQILTAMRRVMRAVDLHSRRLIRVHGLTTPQVLVLKELLRNEELMISDLAKRIRLSQATVTDILNRLERRELVRRTRSTVDKRRVYVAATPQGHALLKDAPPLLQEHFLSKLRSLADWEQNLLLSSLQRIAAMMDAEHIDAAPLLSNGPVTSSQEGPEAADPDAAGDSPAYGAPS
jgi:DNA-binding MarR family transcriptional regulator